MEVEIRPIAASDDAAIANIIRSVGAEFGAIGEGFGPSDDEVASMSTHYRPHLRSLYLVALVDGEIAGGCGIAQFGEHHKVCELKKLFLLPDYRRLGLGRSLSQRCIEFATEHGFSQCYLDTLSNMNAAIELYHAMGFTRLQEPYPGTLHNGCDVWMLKSLV